VMVLRTVNAVHGPTLTNALIADGFGDEVEDYANTISGTRSFFE